MKHIMKKAMGLFVVTMVTVSSGLFSNSVFAAETNQNTIKVNGKGIISVDPDTATVYMGVETVEATAKQAQDANEKIMQKALLELKKSGVLEEDIKTSNYSVYPHYKYDDITGQRTVTGYRASNSIEITTQDIDHTGALIDIGIQSGMNTSNGVSFYVKDKNQYYASALKLAVENARNSANIIASAIGAALKSPIQITEQNTNNSYITVYDADGMNKMESAGAMSDGGPSIQYDKIEITAFVTVEYEY